MIDFTSFISYFLIIFYLSFRWTLRKNSSTSSSQSRTRPLSMIESSQKCQTMFSRTSGSSESSKTFGQTFPNCGTYFFKHVSDGEDDAETDRGSKVEEIESDANCNNVVIMPTLDDKLFEEVNNVFQSVCQIIY
jgi:hypothetical protein